MNERENRDDLVQRVIEQKQQDERRVVSGAEKAQIAKEIERSIMPKVYEDRK